MGEVSAALVRSADAFKQPTLSLLYQRQAPVVVAVLSTCFSRETPQIATARLHVMVEQMLAEIATGGQQVEVPAGTAREVCVRWMNANWLIRSTADDGLEVYSMTSHAQQALDFISNMRQDRTGLSGHRIANIVATARRINRESNPDRDARIAILEAEHTQLSVELDRLRAGGEIAPMSEDRLLEGFDELLSLVAQLPSDFKRVEETFRATRGEILEDFRAERRMPGEVIDRYLRRTDELITATAEGRAFDGAFALLRDEDLLQQLRSDINVLIEQGESFLMDSDRSELRGIVPLMRNGLDEILDQRSRITEVMRTYITSRDPGQDRELDRLLRSLEKSVTTWLQVAGPNEKVPLELLPKKINIETFRERLYDPTDESPLPELAPADVDEAPEGLTLADLRQLGGPHMDQLAKALTRAGDRVDEWTLSEIFAELPADARRPVDMLGLFHLATNSDGLVKTEDLELYSTVRPDGSAVSFFAPVFTPGEAPKEESM